MTFVRVMTPLFVLECAKMYVQNQRAGNFSFVGRRIMYSGLLIAIIVCGFGIRAGRAAMVLSVVPSDQPVFKDQDPEPKEVKDLVASPGRVFATEAWWSGGGIDRTAYFRGDSTSLNEMLDRCAVVSSVLNRGDVISIVVRDDGFPEAKDDLRRSHHDYLKMPSFDWSIEVYSQKDVNVPSSGKLASITIFVNICLSPSMTLEALRIPPNVHVKAISRLDQFADKHETARLGGRQAMLKRRLQLLQKELDLQERIAPASQPEARTATQP